MKPPTKRATSVDVARLAGVSRSTVSFVLNDTPGQTIPPETRAKVLEAARQLDYRPNASARFLAMGRSDIVLFSMPYVPIADTIIRFAEEFATALSERGLTMVAHLAGVHGQPLPDVCASVGASAVISLAGFTDEETGALRRAGVTGIYTLDDDPGGPDRLIGRLQATYLFEQGHRRVGFACPSRPKSHFPAEARLAGVREGCAAAGIEPPLVREVGETVAEAERIAAQWQAQGVSAVAAYNDDTALALLAGARAHGIAVPRDLAVIGSGDTLAGRYAQPPLTSVAFDLTQAARLLAQTVDVNLTGVGSPYPDLPVEPHVVERVSA